MAKLKPIERFAEDVKEGDLVRLKIGFGEGIPRYITGPKSYGTKPKSFSNRLIGLSDNYPNQSQIEFLDIRTGQVLSDKYGMVLYLVRNYEILRRAKKD